MREVAFPAAAPVDAGAGLRCDLLVVGAGLAGCSAALAAVRAGLDVLVVEAEPEGAGASGRNAGFVLLAHVFELPSLRARLGAEALGELLSLARENHDRLRARFGDDASHRADGSLMLSEAGDVEDEGRLEAAAALLRENGVATTLGRPHHALSGFGLQLTLKEDAGLHPGRLLAAMRTALPRYREATVREMGEGVAALVGGAEVRYERAVVATNAHTGALVPSLGEVVTPQRAQMLATAPGAPRVLAPVAYANAGYDYFRQREDGAVLVGGRRHRFVREEATDRVTPTAPVQEALEAYLRRHVPFAASLPVVDRWAGTMGFTPDELPLAGLAPGSSRVHVLVGFTGHGLGLATVLGDRVIDAMLGEASLPAMFAPGRFSAPV